MAPVELVRRSDWERRLIAAVNERRLTPYIYGRNDCACFAQAAIVAVTGVTLMEGAEKPKNWIGAAKFMLAHGWEDVEAMIFDILGPPIPAQSSRPGDVVSFEAGEELHLAVRVGETALTPGREGLEPIGPSAWRNAWRVG